MAVAVADASALAAIAFAEPEEILEAASLTGLTYDASYGWLAHVLGAELVTLDRDLENAFRKRS